MPPVLPAYPDGNEALNAFALGLMSIDQNIPPAVPAPPLMPAPPVLPVNLLAIYQANIARQQAIVAHYHPQIEGLILNNINFSNELYSAFKYAFLNFCAKKNNFIFNEVPHLPAGNQFLRSLSAFKNYVEVFEKIIDQSIFQNIYNNPALALKNKFQAQRLSTPPAGVIDQLRLMWESLDILSLYVNAIRSYAVPIGDMELVLLANNSLGRSIDINTPEGMHQFRMPGAGVPDFVLDRNKYGDWGLQINIANPTPALAANRWFSLLREWNNSLKLCYQFLDKVFDDGIYVLYFVPQNNPGNPNSEKEYFFREFRQFFPEEESQLYGWRGLRTWIANKDNEARANKKGEGLNHSMKEFHLILRILLQGIANGSLPIAPVAPAASCLYQFIITTSINNQGDYKYLSNLIDCSIKRDMKQIKMAEKEKRKLPKVCCSCCYEDNEEDKYTHTEHAVNDLLTLKSEIKKLAKMKQYLETIFFGANSIDFRLSAALITAINNGLLTPIAAVNAWLFGNPAKTAMRGRILIRTVELARTAFIQSSVFGFEYFTQRDLVVKRNGYARYLKQAKDPNSYIIAFNRGVDDEHFKVDSYHSFKVTKKWISNWDDFVNFRKILARVGIYVNVSQKDRDSFKGWSYRRCGNLISLYFISIFIILIAVASIIVSRLVADQKTFDIVNPIATAVIAAASVYVGVAFTQGWQVSHNLQHQKEELSRYVGEFGSVIYRIIKQNLLEEIENNVISQLRNGGVVPPGYNPGFFTDAPPLGAPQLASLAGGNPPTANFRNFKERVNNLVKTKFNEPHIKNEIETVIVDRINDVEDKTLFPKDIIETTGEQLQQRRMQRSYFKRLFATKVRDSIEQEATYNIYKSFGLFGPGQNPPVFEIEDIPQNPTHCYTFDEIPTILGL